jgi:hypothetical protein
MAAFTSVSLTITPPASSLLAMLRPLLRKSLKNACTRLAEIYGESAYLSLELHRPDDEAIAREVVAIGREVGLATVAVQPVYCLSPQDRGKMRLLAAIAGCQAMDVISILRKKRQQVTGYQVEVLAERHSVGLGAGRVRRRADLDRHLHVEPRMDPVVDRAHAALPELGEERDAAEAGHALAAHRHARRRRQQLVGGEVLHRHGGGDRGQPARPGRRQARRRDRRDGRGIRAALAPGA